MVSAHRLRKMGFAQLSFISYQEFEFDGQRPFASIRGHDSCTLMERDVTDLLSQVQAPTLVLHCKGDRMQPIEQGRKMAAGIPQARFVSYESDNHRPTENDTCWPLVEQEIHAFLKAYV
jgi:pimeloyl-ACP methyl ester carboxylesterase